ncbi:MAG: HEAT repeat domain-containing protein [Deltaproteobacteria bacterium]|nr:HEAT repeat domain-containing protein [Candidatus Zymogenaceae bacterium]
MGRDDFSVTPAYSGKGASNTPLIVEDKPRIKGCSCCLIIVVLIAAVGVIVVGMMDPVELNQKLLDVDDPSVKEYAIRNLAHEGDPRAVDALEVRLHDPDSDVRNAAAWALGEIRSPDSVDSLLGAVDTEADYDLSFYAVSSLVKIASRCPDGAPRGEECDDDDVAEQVNYFFVLWSEDDPLIAYIVSNSLFDDDVDVRIFSAQILVHIATEDVRYMLEAALNDEDERVRETAGRALDELDARTSDEPESVPPVDAPNPQADGPTVPAEPSGWEESTTSEHMFPVEVVYPLVEGEFFPGESLDVE